MSEANLTMENSYNESDTGTVLHDIDLNLYDPAILRVFRAFRLNTKVLKFRRKFLESF